MEMLLGAGLGGEVDVVVGLPTLGLGTAGTVARGLGMGAFALFSLFSFLELCFSFRAVERF